MLKATGTLEFNKEKSVMVDTFWVLKALMNQIAATVAQRDLHLVVKTVEQLVSIVSGG